MKHLLFGIVTGALATYCVKQVALLLESLSLAQPFSIGFVMVLLVSIGIAMCKVVK